MNKLLLTLLLISLPVSAQNVQLKFITHNAYGNNLYIDNITVGNRFGNDAAILSINNIVPDTSYTIGTSPFSVNPSVSVINLGTSNISVPFQVTMTVTPGGYNSTKTVNSLNAGFSVPVTFDPLTIAPGQAMNIQVNVNLPGDENPSNNLIDQYSIIFPGVVKTVLLEEWTSSTCGPCAANNPTIDAFVTSKFDSLVAIKYHVGWPSPGNDPMYLYNPTQSYDRRYYYGVNAVPHVIMNGQINPSYPYSNAPSLPTAFSEAKSLGSPLSLSVTDTRISQDSMRADITINIYAPLKNGQYYLRTHAIERKIQYATPPGNNGETLFSDVFRRAFPSSLGTPIPTTVGTHNITITYPMDNAVWVDTMIYTAVFIQNDITKEVLNSGKARNYPRGVNHYAGIPFDMNRERELAPDFSEQTGVSQFGGIESLVGTFQYQLFETDFPPNGWEVKNPDNGITFARYTGVNGPSFGGNNSVKMDFYSYSTTGQKDTLISPLYSGLLESDSVKFDYAYAQYSSTYVDSLIVLLSINNGQTFPFTVFRKGGASLATAPITTSTFVPNSSQWQTHSFSLAGVVPVELSSFTITANHSGVNLDWSTSTETNNYGFEVQRSLDGNSFFTIGFVSGLGTSVATSSYSYIDKPEFNGKTNLYYRLKQIDYDGTFEYSHVLNVEYDFPLTFVLNQNYPNPFNPATKISFAIPAEENVSLKVFDILGTEILTIVDERKPAGSYEIDFDATKLVSGVYIYKLTAGQYSSTKKMTLIR